MKTLLNQITEGLEKEGMNFETIFGNVFMSVEEELGAELQKELEDYTLGSIIFKRLFTVDELLNEVAKGMVVRINNTDPRFSFILNLVPEKVLVKVFEKWILNNDLFDKTLELMEGVEEVNEETKNIYMNLDLIPHRLGFIEPPTSERTEAALSYFIDAISEVGRVSQDTDYNKYVDDIIFSI